MRQPAEIHDVYHHAASILNDAPFDRSSTPFQHEPVAACVRRPGLHLVISHEPQTGLLAQLALRTAISDETALVAIRSQGGSPVRALLGGAFDPSGAGTLLTEEAIWLRQSLECLQRGRLLVLDLQDQVELLDCCRSLPELRLLCLSPLEARPVAEATELARQLGLPVVATLQIPSDSPLDCPGATQARTVIVVHSPRPDGTQYEVHVR